MQGDGSEEINILLLFYWALVLVIQMEFVALMSWNFACLIASWAVWCLSKKEIVIQHIFSSLMFIASNTNNKEDTCH